MSLDPCELCSVGVRKLSGTAALRLRLKSLARARSFHLLGCATTDAKTCRNISAGLRHSSRASPSVSWRPYYISPPHETNYSPYAPSCKQAGCLWFRLECAV